MMIDDDNNGQMIFGDLGGLKLPEICLTGEEKSRETSPRKLVPIGDRTRARCVTGAHTTSCPRALDKMDLMEVDRDGRNWMDIAQDRN